ncbi:MAG: class I SAM-dependent methyltransferase [Candidatus Cloacimonadaceae bacterium]|nr:class I SAM-dependent methyltransferase [Candidatus Cloacimonadaceae bacterium]
MNFDSKRGKLMKDVFRKLSTIDAGKVLDAATGKGEFIQVIQHNFQSYSQIIGIDSSEKSVQFAQKLFPGNDVEIYRMDLRDIHFADSYFDTVCISNSLHHLEDFDKVMAELIRVLRPGGLFLITEMFKDGKQTAAQQTHINMHHWISKIDRISGVYHGETFTKDEIISLVMQLPLVNLEIEDFYYPVDNPKEAKNCENLLKNCKDTIKRLENGGVNQELILEGHDIISRISTIGCASASRLLITAQKK